MDPGPTENRFRFLSIDRTPGATRRSMTGLALWPRIPADLDGWASESPADAPAPTDRGLIGPKIWAVQPKVCHPLTLGWVAPDE